MDNDQSFIENKIDDIVVIKPRLSLFNPNVQAESHDAVLMKSKNELLTNYSGKLISEREQWKNVYTDIKCLNQCLKKKLKNNVNEEPYYSFLNENDVDHANNRPNFYEFMKQVTELQEHAEMCETQIHKLRNQKQRGFRNLKSQISMMEQKCFEYDSR
ncbi:hypothetical protein CBL_04522 [Carabus blaptoides fortunei]